MTISAFVRRMVKLADYLWSPASKVQPTRQEVAATLPGDEVIRHPALTLDRGMTFPASPDVLTGWILQIGKRSKGRAGWYLPARFECYLPQKNRALSYIEPTLAINQDEEIHDWLSFGSVAMIRARMVSSTEKHVIFTGTRLGGWSWELQWREVAIGESRLVMRMRIQRFKHGWLMPVVDYLEKLLVCAPFQKGLTERLNK